MFRKSTAGSIVSSTIAGVAIVGIVFSCSSAESSAQKNVTAKKNTVASAQSVAKVKPSTAAQDTAKTTTAIPPKEIRKIVVYYFHGDARCPTCFKLESYAKSEVENDFADAIKSGKIEWKTVNVDEKGNEHFAEDYKLYTKSVIVSTQQNGKEASWKNLDQIWQLVQNESTYREYIKKEVKACLEGKCL
jgi:hypothetical protein